MDYQWCEDLVDKYLTHLKHLFRVRPDPEGCIVMTPYRAPDNDFLEVRVRRVEATRDSLVISDCGETIDFLEQAGVNVYAQGRRSRISAMLRRNGLVMHDDRIITVPVNSMEEFGDALLRMVEGLSAIMSLVEMARPTVSRHFAEQVGSFLSDHRIVFKRHYIVRGLAKEHSFDFYVPRITPALIQTLSTSSRPYALMLAERLGFAFADLRGSELRSCFVGISVVDDAENGIWTGDSYGVLEKYCDHVVEWTERKELIRLLAQ